jgi:membrane associated rhomboid family serine protease
LENFPGFGPDAGWVSIYRASSRHPCEEQALVLGAMQIDHRVSEQPDGCHVLVPAPLAARATEQLRLYARENPRRLARPWPPMPPWRGALGAIAFALAIGFWYFAQARLMFGIDWLGRGGLEAGSVRLGEWWRVFTALTLHADAAHVAGNMVFGAFFGYLAGQYLGSGVALLLLLWAAAAGNVINAWVQAPGHRSIGASTAVFAALGLVGAFVRALTRRQALSWARRWSPVVGAVALLAYVGTGDERTDVFAHLAGFCCGGLAGFAAFALLSRRPTVLPWPAQAAAGTLTLLTVAVAWLVALGG